MHYDVFICHASEDKDDFVRPLAELLRQQDITVWYDEFSLSVGDSLRQKVDEGLAQSEFGIVVLSPNFFKKSWTNRELNGLTSREMIEQKEVILPIWHRVSAKDVARYSPPLADKFAISSVSGINAVIRALTKKIKPNPSPLVVAKEYLTGLGVETPTISDEWWLDIIEFKEFLKYPDVNSQKRWIFPLPFGNDDRGYERGMNIAAAALQSDWSFEGEELDVGPTSHPDQVHAYLRRWPGLYDTARANPEVLALYVPQLTIPGFDAGFVDVFDKLLFDQNKDRVGGYGGPDTADGNEPLCPDIIALRHPAFGNYKPYDIGRWYFTAHDLQYTRSYVSTFEGLVWLLSPDAEWMPERHRDILIEGIKTNGHWINDIRSSDNPFVEAMYDDNSESVQLTSTVKDGLRALVRDALASLSLETDEEQLLDKLIGTGFIQDYFAYWKRVMERREIRQSKLAAREP
ncbi:MAG: hypothetical protein JWQ84_2648 [Mucilaginibacter sp.]|nr:hypothetical protein [Mucilaginibacter sp.]